MSNIYHYPSNHKSFSYPRENKIHLFRYACDISSAENLKILDWGGNNGNLLRDGMECQEIEPENYTCVDVDQIVIQEMKQELPQANWIYRPVSNPVYSTLNQDLNIELDTDYDVIFCYSVYTHDVFDVLLKDLTYLINHVKSGGKIICSIATEKLIPHVIDRRINEYGSAVDESYLQGIKSVKYLIDNNKVLKEYDRSHCRHFMAFYNPEWLIKQLKKTGLSVNFKVSPHPLVQDCVIVNKE
jgi:hypothetical protein